MMKKLPVTINFDEDKIIGVLNIDIDKIPKQPLYHFAISGKILKRNKNNKITDFEITSISLVPDDQFVNGHNL